MVPAHPHNCNLINENGTLRLKGYVMGQFAKYVRPGSHRVTATYSPQAGVTAMAFTGPKNVIVAINQNSSSKNQTFAISKGTFASPKRFTTSGSKRLADGGTVAVGNGSFTESLDAQSITTFVAEGSTAVLHASSTVPGLERTRDMLRAPGTELVLKDLHGRTVRVARSGDGMVRMDLSGLGSGIYAATTASGAFPVVIAPR